MLNLQTVLRAFQENGLRQDKQFTQDEILYKLDNMGKREFDQDIAQQIFEQCRPIQENLKFVYRLADVSQTLVDASLILYEKIKKAEQQLKQISQNKAVCEKQLAETSVYSDTRFLFLTLLSAKNIPLKLKYTNCQIQLILGVTNKIAKPEQQYDRVNPQFNQDFEFQIPPMITTLTIQFFIQTNANPPFLWGQSYLQIQQLDDQALKCLELQLKDQQGRELGASIEVEAQIVLNKHQYLQTQLQKFDQKIFTLENDLNEYRTDLDVIERPFKIKLIKEQSFKQQQNDVFEQFDQHQQMKQGEQPTPNQLQALEHKEQILSVLQSEKHLEQFDETPDAPEILQHGVIIFSLYGLITLFVCSAKPSFLDVLVYHGLMFTIFMDMFETFHLKLVGGGLVGSIFYDILWMKQYNFWWFSDDQNNPEWGLRAQTLLRFVLILTYIQFLYKVCYYILLQFVVCYYIYQFHRESIDSTKRYSFTIWGIQYKVGRNRNSSYWQSQ